jgi:hypothetical protein
MSAIAGKKRVRLDWDAHALYLVPVIGGVKKRATQWVIACGQCQQERRISYCQAFNILKDGSPRDCADCTGNRKNNRPPVPTKEAQERATKSRIGIKRPYTSKRLTIAAAFGVHVSKEPEARKKISEAHKKMVGEKANNWRGGLVSENEKLRSRPEYRAILYSVLRRDRFTCQSCRGVGHKLEVHHIKEWRNYPELREDPNNMVTLCRPCHQQTDNYAGKAIKKARP